MRYYKIIISDPTTGNVVTPPGFAGLLGGATYTSYVNGQTLPAAWDVEIDVPVIGQATPQGQGFLRVWGISLAEIEQSNNLNGKNIQIFAGMQKGLPLANPAQAGLIAQGTIFQAFGNWIETDQTLDMVIIPGAATGTAAGGTGTVYKPKNIVLNWKAGSSFASAIKSALGVAFPGVTVNVNVSANIVRPNDEVGFFPTLEQLAKYALETSLAVVKTANYPGVSIVFGPNNTINVSDGTTSSGTQKQIAFQDLIGQPTWIEALNMQFKTVMRADLSVGDSIMMPPTITTNTAAANSWLVNQRATFQGGFTLISARHVGRFRQPTADAWVTVFEGAALAPQ